MTKGKSTDGLMRHIRNNHKINIKGSVEKQQLLNMGYYHGYKASLYVKTRDNRQPFIEFQEVKAIYDFDLDMKTIFYPMLVKIETSIKNRLIDYLVDENHFDIEYIYNNKLKDYESKQIGSQDYQKYLKRRLELRKKIDGTIAYNYASGNPAIQHFFHSNKPLPLWAYFEVITFGELGNFISCLSKDYRIPFTETINLHHTGMNQNGRMLENTIFCLTGLRNATMHNSMVFDCRFNNANFSNQLKAYIENTTQIDNITFDTLIDFFILLILLLKRSKFNKTELKKYIREFNTSRETLFLNTPYNTYTLIMGSDAKVKIEKLKEFIK